MCERRPMACLSNSKEWSPVSTHWAGLTPKPQLKWRMWKSYHQYVYKPVFGNIVNATFTFSPHERSIVLHVLYNAHTVLNRHRGEILLKYSSKAESANMQSCRYLKPRCFSMFRQSHCNLTEMFCFISSKTLVWRVSFTVIELLQHSERVQTWQGMIFKIWKNSSRQFK